MVHNSRTLVLIFAFVLVLTLALPVTAGSHLWVVNELFSNADGTIQFIELHESFGSPNEIIIGGKWVSSDVTGMLYTFPQNLPPGSTANKYLLLATAGFAALPGAPTPDYIIEENFFDLDADVIRYWIYQNSPLEFQLGDLPTDGLLSLNREGITEVNSPTNFSDETGSVDLSSQFARGDVDGNGTFNALADTLYLLDFAFTGGPDPSCNDTADADDNGVVNGLVDAMYLLSFGFLGGPGPSMPYPDCGDDPTADAVSCASSSSCP